MKKILSILFCLAFTVNIVLAQDIFITLTKYDESAKTSCKYYGYCAENYKEVGIDLRSNGATGTNTSISIRDALFRL
jgi:hypothetical protein